MFEDALPVPLRQSEQGDSRRRRERSQFAFAAATKSVSSEFNLRERLFNNAWPRSLGRAPHDRRPRLRARPTRGYLAVTQEPHPPIAGSPPAPRRSLPRADSIYSKRLESPNRLPTQAECCRSL